MNNKIDKVLQNFKQKDGFNCYGNLNIKTIYDMEKKLSVIFPKSYIYFLEKLGYMEWFGHSVYGYSNDEDYSTVVNTLKERNDKIPSDFQPVPKNGCIIEHYAGGGYYFLFSKNSNRSGEVALFLDELYGKEAQSWSTFEEFLQYIN